MKPTSYPGHLSFLISHGRKGVSFVPRPISEGRNALRRDCHEPYKSDTMRHLSQSMMFPHTLGILFVNLNQSADSCRFISIKKRNF